MPAHADGLVHAFKGSARFGVTGGKYAPSAPTQRLEQPAVPSINDCHDCIGTADEVPLT